MLKTAGRYTKILNYAVVVLLYVLLALQFLPFWSTADGSTVMSIQEYTWWPLEKPKGPAMTEYFLAEFGSDWKIDNIVLLPCMILVCAIITFFFGIKRPNRLWMNIVYLLAGVGGAILYLADPIYQLNGIWVLHLAICILIAVGSILNVALRPWKHIFHYLKYGE